MRFVKDLAKFTITYVLTWSTYILTRPKVGTTYSIATQTQKKKKKKQKKIDDPFKYIFKRLYYFSH